MLKKVSDTQTKISYSKISYSKISYPQISHSGLEFPEIELPVSEASFPAPFSHALEFNPPAHGTWNIVHIGMNIPEAQQIYVCAINCMRGVVLTAAEMNRSDRFSFVILKEEDLVEGTVEDVTIEGVADVIRKLPKHPPAVCLFTVCTHHFLGCDLNRIYRELEKQFPDIDFMRCYMDPIMQKEGPTPDQKLRINMYRVLQDNRQFEITGDNQPCNSLLCNSEGTQESSRPGDNSHSFRNDMAGHAVRAVLLGSNVSIAETADIPELLHMCGISFKQMTECTSYEEYKKLGEADLFLAVVPNGKAPVESTARRLNVKHSWAHKEAMYLPMSFSYDEITAQAESLLQWAGEKGRITCAGNWNRPENQDNQQNEQENYRNNQDIQDGQQLWGNQQHQEDRECRNLNYWIIQKKEACEKALYHAFSVIGDSPICIDYTVHPRPLGLARLLLTHGFSVEKIYLNSISGEEKDDFFWLQQYAPGLLLCSTIQPLNRIAKRGDGRKILAIGQQAAWYTASPYFVNMAEGGNLQGFDGICRMAALMEDAWLHEKDTKDLIPRKGLGCESCI